MMIPCTWVITVIRTYRFFLSIPPSPSSYIYSATQHRSCTSMHARQAQGQAQGKSRGHYRLHDRTLLVLCIRYIRDVIRCLICINHLMLLRTMHDARQALTERHLAVVQWQLQLLLFSTAQSSCENKEYPLDTGMRQSNICTLLLCTEYSIWYWKHPYFLCFLDSPLSPDRDFVFGISFSFFLAFFPSSLDKPLLLDATNKMLHDCTSPFPPPSYPLPSPNILFRT